MFIQYAKPYYLSLNRGETARVENKFSHMTGLVFSGTAYLYSVDYNGNKSLLKTIRSGESSGTLYAMFDYYNTLVEIMEGRTAKFFLFPPETYVHNRAICLRRFSRKSSSICLRHKDRCFCSFGHLACLSKRSIKGKFMHLLQIYCRRERSCEVDLPFSRDELANYLAVDRASLSRALGELKKAGIIEFKKSHFKLIETTEYHFD